MITLEDVQRMTGIEALRVNSRGHIRLSEGLSLTAKKKALKQAVSFYRKQDKTWRFFLGDMVNDLRLPAGQKKAYCKEAFGEQSGITIYGYSLTAAYWDEDARDSTAPWSLYKEAAQLSEAMRSGIMRQFSRKEIDLSKAFELCREWKAVNMPRSSSGTENDLKTGVKPHSSTLLTANTNSVELQPALKALQCIRTLPDAVAIRDAAQALVDSLNDEEDGFAEE